METKVVSIGGKTYTLTFEDFEEDGEGRIDVDRLLKIDYSNLIGELTTFPIIVNRFGQLLAEAEGAVAEAKLALDVFEAKTKERMRVELAESNGGKAPTVEALNNAVTGYKPWQVLKRKVIECQKVRDYMNSIFWSAKDKSDKLSKLSLTIQDGEVDDTLLEGRVNSVLVRKHKKLIE